MSKITEHNALAAAFFVPHPPPVLPPLEKHRQFFNFSRQFSIRFIVNSIPFRFPNLQYPRLKFSRFFPANNGREFDAERRPGVGWRRCESEAGGAGLGLEVGGGQPGEVPDGPLRRGGGSGGDPGHAAQRPGEEREAPGRLGGTVD